MDSHTEIIIAGLLMNMFRAKLWDFDKLSDIEKVIVGNQQELDVLKNLTDKKFAELMK